MGVLSGPAVGAAPDGLTGALVGMGVPEFEAKRYEARVNSGDILISLQSGSGDGAGRARAILEAEGAEDITTAPENGPEEVAARPILEDGAGFRHQ